MGVKRQLLMNPCERVHFSELKGGKEIVRRRMFFWIATIAPEKLALLASLVLKILS